MTIVEQRTLTPGKSASLYPDLEDAIREYLRTYVLWRGIRRATETFGVSRHTLWRFLERGHTGRALPRAVLGTVGDSVEALEAATWAIAATERLKARRPPPRAAASARSLPQAMEDTLLLLCASPLATVDELSRFGRLPASTLRDRLRRLAKLGMADSVSHSLNALGPHPHRRHFPTEKGIVSGGGIEHGVETFLREYPVSRQWYRLLADRLDAVAMLYRAGALVADADSQAEPLRVDHYRQGPYDMLLTLCGGRSIGLLRQGPTLPSANLRYRLRTLENLPFDQRPMATLVLAGNHRDVVWQQCGGGTERDLPVKVDPGVSLETIIARTDQLAERFDDLRQRYNPGTEREPSPDPDTLYSGHLRSTMPEPLELLGSSLGVRLTGAEKDALDLLAAWPLCTTDQLAGLMGGVTRRRAQPGPQLLDQPFPGVHRRSAPCAHRRGTRLPGPTGQGRRGACAGPLEHPETTSPQRHIPGLRRHRPPGHRLPDGAPRRHHRLRRHADCGGCPFQPPRLRGVRSDAHVPLLRRLSLGLDQLRGASRRLLPTGVPRPIPLLPAGVRATGHHPQAGADPPGELPPVLRQRLAQPGPRRAASPGAVRVPES